MTTRLDSTGAMAGAVNRRCACKIPYSTTARPYSGTCGAKTASICPAADTTLEWLQATAGLAGLSRLAIGSAASAMTTATGTRMRIVQVISAEEVAATSPAAA